MKAEVGACSSAQAEQGSYAASELQQLVNACAGERVLARLRAAAPGARGSCIGPACGHARARGCRGAEQPSGSGSSASSGSLQLM